MPAQVIELVFMTVYDASKDRRGGKGGGGGIYVKIKPVFPQYIFTPSVSSFGNTTYCRYDYAT